VPRPSPRPLGDTASSQLIGFLVGVSVFAATLGYVVLVSVDQDQGAGQAERSDLNQKAVSLSHLLIDSQGEGWYAGAACVAGQESATNFTPDAIVRFGIGSELCAPVGSRVPSNLSYEKIRDMQRALMAADGANGHADYAEARSALGLDAANLDFHIRTRPVLASVIQLLQQGRQDPNLRALYVGDYESAAGPSLQVAHTSGFTSNGTTANVWVRIQNDGLTTTLFEVSFTLHLSKGDITLTRHTPVVLPGGTYNVSIAIPKSSGFSWATTSIDYLVSDPSQVVAQGTISAAGVSMTAATAKKIYEVHSGKLEYVLTGGSIQPKIYYSAWNADGSTASVSGWKLEVYNALGLLVGSDLSLHSRGWESFTLTSPTAHSVRLKDSLGGLLAQETVTALTLPAVGYNPLGGPVAYAPQAPVLPEAGFLAAILKQFDPYVYSAGYSHPSLGYQAGGDIYPDIKAAMNDDLPKALLDDKGTPSPNDDVPTLSRYNVVVVGSNVNHNVMTSAAAKNAIRDWVLAGGTLIVFGSQQQAVQWLQPIFHLSIESASGGISTPDANHPVLSVPNSLDYLSYSSHNASWDFTRQEDEDRFTHVLIQGDTDLLALSEDGAFGDGNVLLTGFQPYDLFDGAEPTDCAINPPGPGCAPIALIHNLVTQAYRGLFLDYGPPVPYDRNQGVSARVATVYHPELGEHVSLFVQVYVF
jgi:hypothetical protein